MKAIILTKMANGIANVYPTGMGISHSLLCEAPREPNTVLVLAEGSDEAMTQMIDDVELNFPWYEVIDETK